MQNKDNFLEWMSSLQGKLKVGHRTQKRVDSSYLDNKVVGGGRAKNLILKMVIKCRPILLLCGRHISVGKYDMNLYPKT